MTSLIIKNYPFPTSRCKEFLSSVNRQQKWSLPNPFIYYISKNPSLPKAYQKMIQSCKYFFFKNPIIVIERLFLNWEENVILLNHFGRPFEMKNVSCKLWVTDAINCHVWGPKTPCFRTSSIIPYIYRCNVKELYLAYQEISFNEFLFLSPNNEKIFLHYTNVKREDGSIVPLETLVKNLPNANHIKFFSPLYSASVTNTVKEIAKYFPDTENLMMFENDMGTYFSYRKKAWKTSVKKLFYE